MSSASLMQIDQSEPNNDANGNFDVKSNGVEEKWFDLKLNRDLLDPNFGGYKLSLDTFAHYKLEMNNELTLNTFNYVESSGATSTQKFFLYQHLKLHGMQNLLIVNHFNDTNLYYFDAAARLVKIVYAMPKLIPVRALVPTSFSLSQSSSSTNERTNPTMKFISEYLAIVYDGYATLYLIGIDQSFKTEDPLVAEKWNILFKWTASSDHKCYASLLKDAILFENDKCHLLLANIHEVSTTTTLTHNNKYELLIHWLELTQQIGETATWSITRRRTINCYESVPEYMALETNGQSVYIAAPSFVEFVYDSEKPISVNGKKLNGNDARQKLDEFKFKKEKFYSWSQTSEEINLTVRLNSQRVEKNLVEVNYKHDFIEIKYESQPLLHGHLFSHIKPDECVWTLNATTNDSIEIVLSKMQSGEMWTSCLKDHDEFGEYKSEEFRRGEGELKHEVANQPMESKTLFTLEQQLEECDGINDDQMMSVSSSGVGGGGGGGDEQEKLTMLRRMDGSSHRVSHKCYINDNKFLFEVNTSAHKCPALCLRHDVDGILWQPHRVSAPASTDTIWLTHEHTFKAFGYVQASKQDAKYRTCPPNLSYVCIVDTQKHIYLYKQNIDHTSSQLKNRKTGQLVTQLAKQHLISLETDKEIFGVYCSNNFLIILLKESCLIYKLNAESK